MRGRGFKVRSFACPEPRSYEGLMLNDVPHNKGVLVFGNGLGGGIQKADRGDRYEGEVGARPVGRRLCARPARPACALLGLLPGLVCVRVGMPPRTAADVLPAPSAVQFDSGFAHGMGQYTSVKGRVYRGEWTSGLRHGCVRRASCWAGCLCGPGLCRASSRAASAASQEHALCRGPAGGS